MKRLHDIHRIAFEKIQNQFKLTDVTLKHPLPERSRRMLGIVKIDGNVYDSSIFSRALFLKATMGFVYGARSIFLSPRIEMALPTFSAEAVLVGSQRKFFIDVQRRGGYEKHDDTELYNRLIAIKECYPELFKNSIPLKGGIHQTFSRASCFVKITDGQDELAMSLFHEYLDIFLELVKKAEPLSGEPLEQARKDFDIYMDTVIDHDPALKMYKIFFGKQGGMERALDMFFAR